MEFPQPKDRKRRNFEILIPVPPEPPSEPPALTKAEQKAQKKKDRFHLNILKQRIQPIMDQIKLKHKKFRTGVIDEAQIRYLYDDEDPMMVSTDLPLEERRSDPSRPYEKATDDHGEPGLIHVATGKFYYNMEIVTIEKRLSNGYYKRPRDFTADVKKLAKDAKAIGDSERIIKANELLTNVEVDMGDIEVQLPQLITELENVYVREKERERELIRKYKDIAAAEGRNIDNITSNVPPADLGPSSNDQAIGPVVLGQPVTNGVIHRALTPSDPSQPSTFTNGYPSVLSDLSDLNGHSHSNGTSFSEKEDEPRISSSEDIQSSERDTQSSSFGPSAQTRPFDSYTGGPTSLEQRRKTPGSLSQRGIITPMAEGSNVRDYTNYASTTSSEKRNTGSSADKTTQSTNEKPEGPDFSMFGEPGEGNSQLPNTQGFTQGKSSHNATIFLMRWTEMIPPLGSPDPTQPNANFSGSQAERSSQTPAVPQWPRERSSINSLLNDPDTHQLGAITTKDPQLIVDPIQASFLLQALVGETSGCSVEQLEQIYSALMSEIWRLRDFWDRAVVVRSVGEVFRSVMEDIRICQGISAPSMEIED